MLLGQTRTVYSPPECWFITGHEGHRVVFVCWALISCLPLPDPPVRLNKEHELQIVVGGELVGQPLSGGCLYNLGRKGFAGGPSISHHRAPRKDVGNHDPHNGVDASFSVTLCIKSSPITSYIRLSEQTLPLIDWFIDCWLDPVLA